MARWSLIQCQAPCTAFAERTSSDRSTWSLLSTGRSKSTMIGMPTPTVSPGFGVTSLTAIVCGACSVVNLLEAAAVVPLRPVAAARTTYDPPGASAHRVRQLLPSADTTPGTVAPVCDRTVTTPSVPLATATTTPRSGRTLAAPFRGLIVSRAAPRSCFAATVPAPPDAPAPSAAWDDAGSPTTGPDAVSSNTAPASDPTLSASPSWRRAKPVRTCTRIRSRTHTSAGPPHQPPLTSPSHLILTLEVTERFRVAESQSPGLSPFSSWWLSRGGFCVGCRGHADGAPEVPGEVGLVVEASGRGAQRDGHAVAEQLLGPPDPELGLVGVRGQSHLPVEGPAEMEGTEARQASQVQQGDGLVGGFVEVLSGGSNRFKHSTEGGAGLLASRMAGDEPDQRVAELRLALEQGCAWVL